MNTEPAHRRSIYFSGCLVYRIPFAEMKINSGADTLPSMVNHIGISQIPEKIVNAKPLATTKSPKEILPKMKSKPPVIPKPNC